MSTFKIPGIEAWMAAMKGAAASWSENIDRFGKRIVDVAHSPKFTIDGSASFFCIGSCFARNIEEHLIYRNMSVLSRRVICPKEEWQGRVNGFVNKFTTHSMRNEIDWVVHRPTFGAELFEEQAGGWIDPQLCPGVRPVSLARAIERRLYLSDDYFSRLRKASIVVVTLGLNEVWFDNSTGKHLNGPPSFYATRRDPDRYELHITDVSENAAQLEEIRRLILVLNPSARIIVTVSPVPMSDTFSGLDVIVANMYSKSTLRAAAEMFARSHANVDYFPSYDIISMSSRDSAYGADCLHVTDAIVGQMMQMFLQLYLHLGPSKIAFNEIAYLEANPDVELAVRRGEIISGFDHWQFFGPQEGRLLTPPDGPTPLMITTGAA